MITYAPPVRTTSTSPGPTAARASSASRTSQAKASKSSCVVVSAPSVSVKRPSTTLRIVTVFVRSGRMPKVVFVMSRPAIVRAST